MDPYGNGNGQNINNGNKIKRKPKVETMVGNTNNEASHPNQTLNENNMTQALTIK